ncbi:efflux RND transporter periplasmic adaptor subunit [Alteromonas sediminis]|uniref:Efflux RND transporter periplasmic adaptor subunit n=1 Tax=Alteromonas sediminis TaxID=2259342 RepID=A0A3N5Y5X8_9ALTE|nr:efflux RND transporter periplasmic adaptor subunit [Alteromonas sediminis]RPJ68626.1 efflux RND transporter periplasmic adaptor subunit [Alteromonas sediminis]
MNRCVTFVVLLWTLTAVAQEMPPAQVEVIQVEPRQLSPTMELQGNVVSRQDALMSVQVEGQLEFIVSEGSRVSKGDIIAKQDNAVLRWQVEREQANITALEAELTFRKSEVERIDVLARQNNASKTQLQLELSRKARTESDLAVAKANLAEAKKRLADSHVKAPFDGVVAMRHAMIGEYLSVGAPLMRLVDLTNLDVTVATPLSVLPHLKEGDTIMVSAATINKLSLPVRKVIPVGDVSSRMFEVRLAANEQALAVGQALRVHMPMAPSQMSIAVPRDAMVIRGAQTFIYRVTADSQAEQIPATLKFAVGDWVAVDSALQSGDKVIIRGAERLMPGQSVQY